LPTDNSFFSAILPDLALGLTYTLKRHRKMSFHHLNKSH
jgi:hypothetical protein